MDFLNQIRLPDKKTSFPKALLHTLLIAGGGILSGAAAKLLDICTANLGNVFSQMSVWMFLCTVIAVCSGSPRRAAVHVFSFCMGMVAAYYVTAAWTASVYSVSLAYGWGVFAAFCPVLGFCVWYAKGKGLLPKLISAGILLFMLGASVVLFDKIRLSDGLFAVLTGVFLMKKQAESISYKEEER